MYNVAKAQRTEPYTEKLPIFNRAMELWHHEHYGAAMQQFDRYLQVGNVRVKKAQSLFYKARCSMELFQKSTESNFLDYINKYPEIGKTDQAYFYLGKFYFRKKEYNKSNHYFAKAQPKKLKPQHSDALYFMDGYASYKVGNDSSAKANFAKLLDHPNNYKGRANYYYGYISYQADQFDTVLKHFREIQNHEKFGRIVPVYITQVYLLKEQFDKTLNYGRQSLQKGEAEKQATIRGYMGEAAYHKGYYDTVIQYLAPVKKQDSLNKSQQFKLAYSYLKEGFYESAAENFKALPVNEDSLGQQVAFHLGEAYTQIDQKEKARNLFQFTSRLDFQPEIKEKSAFRYAKLSYEQGYQKTAKSRLQDFINNYPESQYINEAQNLLGGILLNTKNYQRALSIIEQVPDMNEQMKKAYQQIAYKRGLELYQDTEYGNARELFIKALDYPLKPRFKALSYFWLGESYYHLKSYSRAIRAYQNFLYQDIAKETPYKALASYNIGYSHFKTEAYEKAVNHFETYRREAESSPENERFTDAAVRMADCHFANSNYDKAKKLYSEAIDRDHKSVPYAMYQKGIILGLQGKKDQKIDILNKLSQNHRESAYVDDALFEIGNVYFIRGEHQLAFNQFRYLTQDYKKTSYYRLAHLKMGLVRYNQDQKQAAVDKFKEVVRKFPYSQEAKEAIDQLKTVYIDMGQADSLFAFLKSVESADLTASFQDSASYSSAFSYFKDQNCTQAINAFQKYLDEYPEGHFAINAHFYLAQCAREEGLRKEAIENYETVVNKGETQFTKPALRSLSRMYRNLGKCEQAIPYMKELRNTTNERKDLRQALNGLMRCHYKLMDYQESANEAQKLLQLPYLNESDKNEARYYLAKSYFELNQYEKALPVLKPVYKQNSGEKGAEALYLKAVIEFRNEQYKNAQQTVYKLRDEFTNYNYWVAKGFVLLGDVFMKLGDQFQAKATLQSVIDNYEGDELAQKARKKLKQIKQQEEKADKADSTNAKDPDSLNKRQDE